MDETLAHRDRLSPRSGRRQPDARAARGSRTWSTRSWASRPPHVVLDRASASARWLAHVRGRGRQQPRLDEALDEPRARRYSSRQPVAAVSRQLPHVRQRSAGRREDADVTAAGDGCGQRSGLDGVSAVIGVEVRMQKARSSRRDPDLACDGGVRGRPGCRSPRVLLDSDGEAHERKTR